MKKRNFIPLYYIYLIPVIVLIASINGCKNSSEPEPPVDESATLLKYLEDNGDYINTQAPSTVTAEEIRNAQINGMPGQVIIDLRNPEDFVKGHIQGAVNLGYGSLLDYVYKINPDRIVLTCYGGQTSSYAAGLLRLNGRSNVYSMRWGMSAWDTAFAKDNWLVRMGNSKRSLFTTAPTERPAKDTTMPTLNTGKRKPWEILTERVRQLLNEGFIPARITPADFFSDMSKHFVVSYCDEELYSDPGHIQNAVNYRPKIDLKSDANLKKLPLGKSIVLYCATGQSSGYAVSYLRLLGYDAKFVIYGASGMIYDDLKDKGLELFTKDDIKNYPYVKGN